MAIKVPQVSERALPSTTGVRTPGADAFGAGVGQSMAGLGGNLADIGLDLQNKENEAKTRETDTYYSRKLNDLKNGYKQQNGKTAYDSQQDYDKAVADLRREALDMLDNDAQKAMLSPLLDRKETDALQFGSAHAIQSLKQWNIETLDAQKVEHLQAAATHYGTEQGAAALAAMRENIEDIGYESGWPPEKIEKEYQAAVGAAAETRIEQLAVDYPTEAKKLLESERDTIDPMRLPALERKVDGEVAKYTRAQMVDIIMMESGGDPKTMWDMTRTVDPEHRAAVQTAIKNEIAMKQAFEKESQKDLDAKLEQQWVAKGDQLSEKDRPNPETTSAKMMDQFDKRLKRAIDRQREVPPNPKLYNQKMGEFQEDPRKFAADWNRAEWSEDMSPEELDKIDAAIRRQKGDKSAPKSALTRVQLENEVLSSLRINRTKQSERAERILNGLRDRISAVEEENGGQPLTWEQQKQIKAEEIYQFKTEIRLEDTGRFYDDRENLNEFINKGVTLDDGSTLDEATTTWLLQLMDAEGIELTDKNLKAYATATLKKSSK